MVKIITDILFEEELDKYLDDAYEQYGQKCVGLLLRGAILMDNFKIIYHYDENEENIYLHDIWDMRNNPRKLKMRFNQFKHI